MDCNEKNCGYHQTKTLSKMNKKELYEFSKIASEQNFKITHFAEFVVNENNELKEEINIRISAHKQMIEEIKELKKQFNNIINLIKTADTDEKIKLLKELDTLD